MKRKKKHGSFVSKMKKYHRKGSVGRGNHIEEETYLYFLRMYEAQKKGFDSEDDKSKYSYCKCLLCTTEFYACNVQCSAFVCISVDYLRSLFRTL